MSITEDEFNEIAKSHRVFPNEIDPKDLETGKKLPDEDFWDKSSNLDREYTQKKLKDHNF